MTLVSDPTCIYVGGSRLAPVLSPSPNCYNPPDPPCVRSSSSSSSTGRSGLWVWVLPLGLRPFPVVTLDYFVFQLLSNFTEHDRILLSIRRPNQPRPRARRTGWKKHEGPNFYIASTFFYYLVMYGLLRCRVVLWSHNCLYQINPHCYNMDSRQSNVVIFFSFSTDWRGNCYPLWANLIACRCQ